MAWITRYKLYLEVDLQDKIRTIEIIDPMIKELQHSIRRLWWTVLRMMRRRISIKIMVIMKRRKGVETTEPLAQILIELNNQAINITHTNMDLTILISNKINRIAKIDSNKIIISKIKILIQTTLCSLTQNLRQVLMVHKMHNLLNLLT